MQVNRQLHIQRLPATYSSIIFGLLPTEWIIDGFAILIITGLLLLSSKKIYLEYFLPFDS